MTAAYDAAQALLRPALEAEVAAEYCSRILRRRILSLSIERHPIHAARVRIGWWLNRVDMPRFDRSTTGWAPS